MTSGEISGIRNNLECNVSDSENPTNTSWQMSIHPNFCKIKERKGTLNIGFIRNRMQRKFLAAFNWMQKKYFSTKTWWRKRDLCIFSRRFWVVFSSLCGTCKHLCSRIAENIIFTKYIKVISAISCWWKALRSCTECPRIRADFIHEVRSLEGHPIWKLRLLNFTFTA